MTVSELSKYVLTQYWPSSQLIRLIITKEPSQDVCKGKESGLQNTDHLSGRITKSEHPKDPDLGDFAT